QMIDRLLFILVFVTPQSHRVSAQSVIGDFINSAMTMIVPIVEDRVSSVRQQMTLARPMLDSQQDPRVFGRRTPQSGPLFNGNSRLSAFIACQAENIKNDQGIANLNLAAQVLADKKLRNSVVENPEMIHAGCMDSGMDSSRCSTFTRGFQSISRLINTMEGSNERMQQRSRPASPPTSSSVLNPALSLPDGTVHSSRMGRRPGDPRLHRPLGVQRTAWRDPGSWGTSVPRTTPLRTVTVERFTTIDGRR
ncbi:hypothetical protein PMAYCL1PPCAC_00316, partial [Pristionchus mayeri]